MSKKSQGRRSGKQGAKPLTAGRIVKLRLPTEASKPDNNPFLSPSGQILVGNPQPAIQKPDAENSSPQGTNTPANSGNTDSSGNSKK